MQPEAIIVARPNVDFSTFIGISMKVLGYSPSRAADAAHREVSETERWLSCLAAVRDESAGVALTPRLLSHATFSVLIVADGSDITDIVECCPSMAFVTADTLARNVRYTIITGNLCQWRDAVVSGCDGTVEPTVRMAFNKIHGLFLDERLNIWADFRTKTAPDNLTFLLEDKRPK